MAVYRNSFEGGTDGVTATAGSGGNTGGTSGTPIANFQGTNGWKFDATAATDGSMGLSYLLETGTHYARVDDPTASGRGGIRIEFKYPGNPPSGTATLLSLRHYDGSTDVGVTGLQIQSTGIPQVIRANAGTVITTSRPGSAPWVAGDDAVVELLETPGASTTTAKLHCKLAKMVGSTQTDLFTWDDGANYDVGSTGPINRIRIGQMLSTQWADTKIKIDTLAWGSLASSWFGRAATPPTIVLTTNGAFYVVDMRASTGTSTPTYSIAWVSGPDNTSGLLEPIDGLFFIPIDDTASSVYLVTAAVGGNIATQEITVPPAAAVVDSVRRRVYIGGAWV